MKDFLKNLSTTRIVLIGLVLILIAQAISWTFLKVDVGALVANIGALLLVVGLLQWVFDEESRASLVNKVVESVSRQVSERDRCGAAGIRDCLTDSKAICSPPYAEELANAQNLALGFQYSDGLIDRYRQIINQRIANNLPTQIAHVRSDGVAASYISRWKSHSVDVKSKVEDMLKLIDRYFGGTPLVKLATHDVVIRYSFVYTESAIWMTWMTNSSLRQPLIPTLKIASNSPLYQFLKSDIAELGVSV